MLAHTKGGCDDSALACGVMLLACVVGLLDPIVM
jgi:hypothetical protein